MPKTTNITVLPYTTIMDRNIVLLCLDSVREDIFDETAVRIQELANISFDSCRAASSWSAPSHASMISGTLPSEHNVTTHSRSFDSLSREDTVFADLRQYRTVGISGNIYAGPAYNFDQYFDSFFTLERGIRFPRGLSPYASDYDMSFSGLSSYFLDSINHDNSINSLSNGFTTFLDKISDIPSQIFDQGAKPGLRIAYEELQKTNKPSLIFLNLMEGHIPYQPARYLNSDLYDVPDNWNSDKKDVWELIENEYDERYWNRRNQLYRATIDYLDRRISKFIQSVGEETTVIITADHGDNLGTEVDEGLANHKSSLSEGVLHVPLHIINAPEISEQTGEHLSQLSLPKLISGIQEGHIPDLTSDRIFAELGGMSAGPDPETRYKYYDRAMRCAYDKSEKIIWDSLGDCAKYDLDSDSSNYQIYVNEIDQPPSWAREFFKEGILEFKSRIIENRSEVNVDESTVQRLEELGYL